VHKKKKKKRTGASAFIDDIAEEEDGGDDEDDEDDGDGEEDLDEGEREAVELEAQQRIHARYQNMENMERMENEEEIEKQIKERYAAHLAGFDGDVVGSAVDQQALHPTVQDPKLWLVTVKQGKERETVVCLMQKAINMHKTGKGAVAIKSACVQDHLKSYIYVEAERESDVKKALTGMRHVYHSKPIKLVPINEMVDSITVTKKKVENIQYQSWVRMRGGVYKGDLARVIDINYADNQCSVQLVPRFDYALLQAKEEGTAAGRAKPNAALRPPARLFTEAEARKYNLSLERGRMDRRTGDRLDILCGVHKLRDGYFIKTISLASCKLAGEPPLDELQRYTAGEDAAGEDRAEGGAGKSMTEANLEALAASLGDRSAGADQVFRTGDQVVIIKGDLKNLTGIVDRVLGDGTVKIKPEHELLHDVLDVDKENLRKSFKIGSHVRCIQGRHEGEAGLVVKVEGEVATVFSDVTKEEFLVFSHHLADSAETTHRVETLGEYGVHDLALLKDDSVGMLIRVEKDAAMLMMSTSNFDRPDVRAVRLHDFQRKLQTRTLTAVDSAMETIESKSMCRIVDGPGKGTTITVEHIWKGTLWGKARGVSEHGGMLVCRSRDVKIHGGRAKDPVTGGKGFGAVPMSPGSALLRSPSRQDTGGPQAAPQRGRFGGGAVGRRDAGLIGSGVKVTAGVYKGYKGKVVDATETTVRVELQAQGRTGHRPAHADHAARRRTRRHLHLRRRTLRVLSTPSSRPRERPSTAPPLRRTTRA
jgi:transcription elongation factor SPT5